MTAAPITTKTEMYAALLGGKFGNICRAWDSLTAVKASGYRGYVSLRSKQVANPIKMYHVPYADLAGVVAALPTAQRAGGLVFSESPPDDKRVIQGEVCRREFGLYLTYTFVGLPMRLAFAKQQLEARGLRAKLILEHYLAPEDVEHLNGLLDTWQDHVVEFSAFACRVGTWGRRMVIWEVRLY